MNAPAKKCSAEEMNDGDFSPSPPSAAEIEFDTNVAIVGGNLASIANRHDATDVAWALDLAFRLFENLRPAFHRLGRLSGDQRDALLADAVVARAGVEIHCLGSERDVYIDGLRALQHLVVHFAGPLRLKARVPDDRLVDLWRYVRIAKNTAGTAWERHLLGASADQRAIATLDLPMEVNR